MRSRMQRYKGILSSDDSAAPSYNGASGERDKPCFVTDFVTNPKRHTLTDRQEQERLEEGLEQARTPH